MSMIDFLAMPMPMPRTMAFPKIIESDLAMEKTDEPERVHDFKPWMTKAYHKRIQKKWVKRFGHVWKPCCYETPGVLICHPIMAREIKKTIKDRFNKSIEEQMKNAFFTGRIGG